MSPTARALLSELLGDPEGMRELADALAAYMPAPQVEEDRWLTSAEAAVYLGMSKHALHKLTASRRIPFSQDGPSAKCWFRRAELADWRVSGGASAAPTLLSRVSNSAR